MARGNLIQGQASGKLGDTVLMVRNGQQLARVYTTSGARSGEAASESARIQRVKFGSASNQWNAYRYVSTRMFRKGRTKNQSDYNYWVKRNNQLLPYLTKAENSLGVKMLQPGVFSEGSLGTLAQVISFEQGSASTVSSLGCDVVGIYIDSDVDWASKVVDLKAQLRAVLPNASKVTYLITRVHNVSLEEEGREYISQVVEHFPVTLDLFDSRGGLDNTQAIKTYFANVFTDSNVQDLFTSQDGNMASVTTVFNLEASSAPDKNLLAEMSVMMFATNDSVSDCYTTSVSAVSVNPTEGPFVLWAEHRTAEALGKAASSYGYQSGVMRDEVSSFGSDIVNAANDYAARLAEISPARAAAYRKNLEAKLAAAAASPAAGASSEE